MDVETRIRPVGPSDQNLLIGMYNQFDPLGAALGLPPYTVEARCEWIAAALAHQVSLAAFSSAGEVVGHCFLASDKPGSAEMAIFVHQKSRRKGVGRALLMRALDLGAAAGLRRVWSMTSPDNQDALRLQISCGFCPTKCFFPAVELEIDLSVDDHPDHRFKQQYWSRLGDCEGTALYS